MGGKKKVIGKCESCQKSQVKKDAERRVVMAEAAGEEDTINDADLDTAEGPTIESDSKWCCLYCVILLQDNFVNEKPMIQHYLEEWGHLCIFYLKFHCEFNDTQNIVSFSISSFPNVSTWWMSSLFNNFFRNRGVIWTHIGTLFSQTVNPHLY